MNKHMQAGFTAIEVIIALAVVGMMVAVVLGPFGSYLNQWQKEDTLRRVKEASTAVQEAYRREIATVGDAGGSNVRFGGVDIGNNTAATGALFKPFERYSSSSSSVLAQDGFNQPYRVFVSNELTQTVSGATLSYRVIALVSPGRNGKLDSSFDVTTGALTVGGDDVAEVINGYVPVKSAYDDASRKLQALGTAYQNYFLTRFLANPTRSVSVDYFANSDASGTPSGNWDSSGTVLSSSGGVIDADVANLHTALGLSLADVTTQDGQRLQVDNSSADVNQPDQSDPNRALPPYSVKLSAPLPGGNQVVMSISGIYN